MTARETARPARCHGRSWLNGECPRKHDVTNPANVRLIQRRGRVQRIYRLCNNGSRAAHRRGEDWPPVAVQRVDGRACARCGEVLMRRDKEMRGPWLRRRFCNQDCYRLRGVPPLSGFELSRLRALVGVQS